MNVFSETENLVSVALLYFIKDIMIKGILVARMRNTFVGHYQCANIDFNVGDVAGHHT